MKTNRTNVTSNIVIPSEAVEAVLATIPKRAHYQRGLVTGAYRWSGSDLRGKARRFGRSYAHSRATVVGKIEALGYRVDFKIGVRGLRYAEVTT